MTVTIDGIIKNAGEDELTGTIRVTANKNFTDSGGEFHIAEIPFISDVTDGEFSITLPATIKNEYTTASLIGDIISFEAIIEGIDGNDITITIEDGTISGSLITINEGLSSEEIYDNLDMDETSLSTYIVNVINNESELVNLTRVSELSDDTLPTNQVSTNLTGGSTTNLIKYKGSVAVSYKFEFLNQYNQVYSMLSKIELPYSSSPIDFDELM